MGIRPSTCCPAVEAKTALNLLWNSNHPDSMPFRADSLGPCPQQRQSHKASLLVCLNPIYLVERLWYFEVSSNGGVSLAMCSRNDASINQPLSVVKTGTRLLLLIYYSEAWLISM